MEIMFLLALIIGLGFWLLRLAEQDVDEFFRQGLVQGLESGYPDADYFSQGWVPAVGHPLPGCPECLGTGELDSGGAHPWGASVTLACPCRTLEGRARLEANAQGSQS